MPDSRPKGTTPLRKSGMHDTPTDRSSPHSWHCQIPAIRVRVTPTLPDRTRYVTSSVLAAARAGARTHARTERDTIHDWVRVPFAWNFIGWPMIILRLRHARASIWARTANHRARADEPGGAAPWAPPLPSPAAPAWICSTARSRSTSRVRWSSFRPSFSRPPDLVRSHTGSRSTYELLSRLVNQARGCSLDNYRDVRNAPGWRFAISAGDQGNTAD
jgi:hypothetical protein